MNPTKNEPLKLPKINYKVLNIHFSKRKKIIPNASNEIKSCFRCYYQYNDPQQLVIEEPNVVKMNPLWTKLDHHAIARVVSLPYGDLPSAYREVDVSRMLNPLYSAILNYRVVVPMRGAVC